jgi:hypothetical protein
MLRSLRRLRSPLALPLLGLALAAGAAHAETPAPPPPAAAGARVAEAIPFSTAAGELVGTVWLEGAARDRLAVRWAAWTGAGWGPSEEISPPGPGSQLALAGARLADGRLLVAWARFDGGDDEIVFALRAPAGRWSAPAPVAEDNGVPDVTPAAIAADEGALLAWSRYEAGEYRVAVARYDGERFRPARLVGPPGSLYPSFEGRGAGGPRLLFRNARPRGWTVAELDRSGAARRSAFLAATEAVRPQVSADGERVVLTWGERRLEGAWR